MDYLKMTFDGSGLHVQVTRAFDAVRQNEPELFVDLLRHLEHQLAEYHGNVATFRARAETELNL